MLTDTQLKNIKATGKLFKVADRDGLYIAVTKTGQIPVTTGHGHHDCPENVCWRFRIRVAFSL